VIFAVLEIAITFLPGGAEIQETVVDYFLFFQRHPLLGMRNLGLVNIGINTMLSAAFFAIYAAHRDGKHGPLAALIVIIANVGLAVFFATNRAFSFLALSRQYALAASGAQRAMLEAAGQAMLSVGASHTPGTFLAFFLMETAGFLISVVMLRGKVFTRLTAIAGMIGFGLLLVFEIITSFVAGVTTATTLLAVVGGIASMVWYGSAAATLFRLGKIKAS
jgi:uncharacterized membrane protein